MNRVPFVFVAMCGALAAQKVAMTDGSNRHVAIVDVSDLVHADAEAPAAQGGRWAATSATRVQELARFVRMFAPAIAEPGADLQPLGDRHLVALGRPEQVAEVERAVVRARENKDGEFFVDLRMLTVPAAIFDRELANVLAPSAAAAKAGERAPLVGVLDPARGPELVRTLVGTKQVAIVQSPQIVALPLDLAHILVGKQRQYVRDFEVDVANAAFDLKPVNDTVFDGFEARVRCAKLGVDTIGVLIDLVDQTVAQPIAEQTTTLPGTTQEVTVQTPRVIGTHGSQAVEMKNGETAVMATRKLDGSWSVSFLTIQAIRSAPAAMPLRR